MSEVTEASLQTRVRLEELREEGHGQIMGYYAKGFHDRQWFAKLVEEHANAEARDEAEFDEEPRFPIRVPVPSVVHQWWRKVPNREDGYAEGEFLLVPAKPRSNGAFRVTVTEHSPLAGWDGTRDRVRGQACWCPACGQMQRQNATSHLLYARKHRNAIWRTARDWRGGWVLMDGDQMTDSFPCKYIRHEDVGNAYCDEQLRKHNIVVPGSVAA